MRLLVAASIGLMLLIGNVDVAARYIFDSPLDWALPVVGLLLGMTIFCGLPIISRDDEHITVSLLDRWVTGFVQKLQAITVNFLSLAALLFMSERMFTYGTISLEDQTQHMMIDLSIWPYAYIFSAMSLISAFFIARNIFRDFRKTTRTGER